MLTNSLTYIQKDASVEEPRRVNAKAARSCEYQPSLNPAE